MSSGTTISTRPTTSRRLVATGKRVRGSSASTTSGGALEGPIPQNRAFFSSGRNYKYIRRQTNSHASNDADTAELAGNFSQRLAGADRIPGQPTTAC